MIEADTPADEVRRSRNRYNRMALYIVIAVTGLVAIDRVSEIEWINLSGWDLLSVASSFAMIWVFARMLPKYADKTNG